MLEMLLAASLYSTEARVYSDRWLPRVASGMFRIEIRVHVQLLTVADFEAELGLHLDIVEYIIVVTAIYSELRQ